MNSEELRSAYLTTDVDAMVDFDRIAAKLHVDAKNKGFYDSLDMTQFNSQAKQLMMLVSECSETMEALRKEQGEDRILDEISDIAIRLLDFYGALIDAGVVKRSLNEAFVDKVLKNLDRPKMHGVLG